MKKTIISVLFCSFALISNHNAFAQDDYEAGPAYGEQFNFELRGAYWNSSLESTVKADSGSIKGTNINVVSDLGLDGNKGLPFGQLTLKFAERHKIVADYIALSYSGDKVVNQSLVFNGVSYAVSSRVSSTLDLKSAKFGYEYDIARGDAGYLAFKLAANYVYANASIVTANALSNSVAMDAWAPVIGLSGRISPIKMVSLTLDVAGIAFDKSSVTDGAIYLDINPLPNIGFSVGWRTIKIVVDVEGKKADTQWGGVFGGMAVRF